MGLYIRCAAPSSLVSRDKPGACGRGDGIRMSGAGRSRVVERVWTGVLWCGLARLNVGVGASSNFIGALGDAVQSKRVVYNV